MQKEYINCAFAPGVGRNSSLSVAINRIVLLPAAIKIFVFPEKAIFTAVTARLSEPIRLCLEGTFSFFLSLTGRPQPKTGYVLYFSRIYAIIIVGRSDTLSAHDPSVRLQYAGAAALPAVLYRNALPVTPRATITY